MDQNEVPFDRAQKSMPRRCELPGSMPSVLSAALPALSKKALGPHMYDVEGKQYIDYIGSSGSYDPRSQQSSRH